MTDRNWEHDPAFLEFELKWNRGDEIDVVCPFRLKEDLTEEEFERVFKLLAWQSQKILERTVAELQAAA